MDAARFFVGAIVEELEDNYRAKFQQMLAGAQRLKDRYIFLDEDWDWRVEVNGQCRWREPGQPHKGERICEFCGIAVRG